MESGKILLTVEDVAENLETDLQDAERIVRELNVRIVRMGGICMKGMVLAAFYRKMKDTGFTSPEGAPEPDQRKIREKRLLSIEEFCFYSGMQRKLADRFAKEIGIEKRVLYDRVRKVYVCSVAFCDAGGMTQVKTLEPMPMETFCPHSMRHTFATGALEKGIPPKAVQSYLGNSTIDVTMNIYTHVTSELEREEIKKIASQF